MVKRCDLPRPVSEVRIMKLKQRRVLALAALKTGVLRGACLGLVVLTPLSLFQVVRDGKFDRVGPAMAGGAFAGTVSGP